LKDYLSCRVIEDINKNRNFNPSTSFNQQINRKFGNEVSDMRIYGTPGTPRFKITFPDQGSDTIPESLQRNYRLGVGI
jgi:hypothetical protein